VEPELARLCVPTVPDGDDASGSADGLVREGVAEFICPACQRIGQIDLRSLDRHPNATIESLIPSLSCRRCQPNPPFVKLLGLRKLPTSR
jgi:hypothetical protein